jgi:hypothetical protein
MQASLLVLAMLTLTASACGGVQLSNLGSEGGTDSSSNDGNIVGDAGTCGIVDAAVGDGGCFLETPTQGSCCVPGQSICQKGDPCCVGAWQCNGETKTWEMEALGCACEIDAAPPPLDAPSPDAGVPTECGKIVCNSHEICVVQTSTAGPCIAENEAGMCPPHTTLVGGCCTYSSSTYSCEPEPASCDGTLSCGCAASLCSCECTGASGSTLQCACLGA